MKLTDFISDKKFRKVLYYPDLSVMLGSATAAIILSHLIYWHDKGSDPDWIFKAGEEWEDETGLSRSEVETGRKKLRALGLLHEKRCGIPARMFFQLNKNQLNNMWYEYYNNVLPQRQADRETKKDAVKKRRLAAELEAKNINNIVSLQASCKQENNEADDNKSCDSACLLVTRKQVCKILANKYAGTPQTTTGITTVITAIKKPTTITKSEKKQAEKDSSSLFLQKTKINWADLPDCIKDVVPVDKRSQRHLDFINLACSNFTPEIVAENIVLAANKSNRIDPWGLIATMLQDMAAGADRHQGDRQRAAELAEKQEKERLRQEKEEQAAAEEEERARSEAASIDSIFAAMTTKEKSEIISRAEQRYSLKADEFQDVIMYFVHNLIRDEQLDKAA